MRMTALHCHDERYMRALDTGLIHLSFVFLNQTENLSLTLPHQDTVRLMKGRRERGNHKFLRVNPMPSAAFNNFTNL